MYSCSFASLLSLYSFSFITTLFSCQSGTTELLLHLSACGIIMTLFLYQFCILKWFSHYYVSIVTWLWLYYRTHSVPVFLLRQTEYVSVWEAAVRNPEEPADVFWELGNPWREAGFEPEHSEERRWMKSRRFQTPVLTALPRRTWRISSCSIRPAPPPWSPWNTNGEWGKLLLVGSRLPRSDTKPGSHAALLQRNEMVQKPRKSIHR